MIFLNTFLYYVCFASVVLIYGIGANKVFELNLSRLKNITYCIKIILSIMISAMISWFVTKGILVPLKMTELYPLVSFLIYICLNTFLEALIRLTTNKSATEFVFSYLVIILSIAESTSFVNTIIITFSCLCSFLLTIPFITAFKQRNNDVPHEKYFCRLFLYIAILILIISVWDIMWINPEVIQ